MSAFILTPALLIAQIALALAALLAFARILTGPRAQDRVLALDAFYVTVMLLMLIGGLRDEGTILHEGALVIAMAGFVSTVAAARFLLRGEVIE